MGRLGAYGDAAGSWAKSGMQKADGRRQNLKRKTQKDFLLPSVLCPLLSVIRRSSSDPVADQFDLYVGEVRAALRHAIAGDAGADDLAIEIRIRRIERSDEDELRHLHARFADDLKPMTCCQDK